MDNLNELPRQHPLSIWQLSGLYLFTNNSIIDRNDLEGVYFMLSSTLVPVKDIVYTDFQGTGGILVDLNTKQYYQLNETGSLIWRALEKGDSVEDIVSEMQTVYEVSAELAHASVEKLLLHLESSNLVRRT